MCFVLPCLLVFQVFKEWNKGELDSFLIEITADIMAYRDTDGTPLVEKIRDAAGQKGTGKWTAISALDKGHDVCCDLNQERVKLSLIPLFENLKNKKTRKDKAHDVE